MQTLYQAIIAFLTIATAVPALADSRCWPEERLLGTNATAYYFDHSEAPNDLVPVFDSKGVFQKALPCEMFTRLNGPCGYENSYLAVYGEGPVGLLPVKLKQGELVYINPRNDDELHQVLPNKSFEMGEVATADGKVVLRAAPDTKAPIIEKDMAVLEAAAHKWQQPVEQLESMYALGERVRNDKGVWIKLAQKPIYYIDGGSTYKQGDIMRKGYLRLQDTQGTNIAVITEAWCD